MNPLNSIKGVWILGFVLAIILAVVVNLAQGAGFIEFNHPELWRWLHVIAGIVWIGLLYYFNFVQIPAVASAGSEAGPINKFVAPVALLWFRWAAGRHLCHRRHLSGGHPAICECFLTRLRRRIRSRLRPAHGHRRLAGHHHGPQCLGPDLAQPEKSTGHCGSQR